MLRQFRIGGAWSWEVVDCKVRKCNTADDYLIGYTYSSILRWRSTGSRSITGKSNERYSICSVFNWRGTCARHGQIVNHVRRCSPCQKDRHKRLLVQKELNSSFLAILGKGWKKFSWLFNDSEGYLYASRNVVYSVSVQNKTGTNQDENRFANTVIC